MPSWVPRTLGMAVLHAAATVALAKIAVFHPTDVTPMTVVSLAVLVGAAALWSALDAWLGGDRPGRTWFIAALVAGPVSGVLGVVGRGLFVDETGVSALGPALTGGAAFTALLVLVPAGLGVLVGTRVAAPRGGDPGADTGDAREPTGGADTGARAGESRGPGDRYGAAGQPARSASQRTARR